MARLVSASLVVGIGFVGSRLLGLARDMVISHVFGTSPDLDAYFAAFRLPDLIFQLLAGAALGSAFIPTFASYLNRGDEGQAWKLATSLLNLIALTTLLLSLLTMVLAPWLVPLVVPGFDASGRAMVVQLTRTMLWAPVFFCVSGLAMAVLNARHRFLLPALAPWFYNLSIIFGALGLSRFWGVMGLAWGVVLGAALHLLVQTPGLAKAGMRYQWSLALDHPGVKEVGRLMLPRVGGLAAVQVNFLIITILASTLPVGSLASLNYAWVLMMMPLGIFSMSISTVAFPTLAEQVAAQQLDAFRRTLMRNLRLILFLIIPASVGLIVLREPIVALIYQRGRFDVLSTQTTAWALLFYSIGLCGHASLEILARGFYALHDTKTPVVCGVGSMLVHLGLSLFLMRFLGHGGLALSLSLSTLGEATVLYFLLRNRFGSLDERTLGRGIGKSLIASLVMGVVLLLLQAIWPFEASLPWLVGRSLALISVGMLTFGVLAMVLEKSYTQQLWHQLRMKRASTGADEPEP